MAYAYLSLTTTFYVITKPWMVNVLAVEADETYSLYKYTVKPVLRGNIWDKKVALLDRYLLKEVQLI